MKKSILYVQSIWIIRTLKNTPLTLKELSRKWQDEKVNDGNPLPRTTFQRYRNSIEEMFGISIKCNASNGYKYYITDLDLLESDALQKWMYNTLSVASVLIGSKSLSDRILLEEVPVQSHLATLIEALKSNNEILLTYARYGKDAYTKVVQPYAIKYWHQRWYLLANTTQGLRTYSMDRMRGITKLQSTFKYPEDFSPKQYFEDYFGVMADQSVPLETITFRAYGDQMYYIKDVPLHSSQRVIASKENEYTDFQVVIRPTKDFYDAIESLGDKVVIMDPPSAIKQMALRYQQGLNIYETLLKG